MSRRWGLLLLLLLAPRAAAIANGSETKLAAVGALGLVGQPHHCTAVLVAPTIALTARHCWGVVGWAGDFELRFDNHTSRVLAWHVSSTQDAALVYLDSAPAQPVQPLPVLLQEPPKPEELLLVGWGKEGPGLNEGEPRLLACMNTLWAGSGVAFWSAWDPAGLGCGPNTGDSGGAALVTYRSRLVVVGVIVGPTTATPLWLLADDPVFLALQGGDL